MNRLILGHPVAKVRFHPEWQDVVCRKRSPVQFFPGFSHLGSTDLCHGAESWVSFVPSKATEHGLKRWALGVGGTVCDQRNLDGRAGRLEWLDIVHHGAWRDASVSSYNFKGLESRKVLGTPIAIARVPSTTVQKLFHSSSGASHRRHRSEGPPGGDNVFQREVVWSGVDGDWGTATLGVCHGNNVLAYDGNYFFVFVFYGIARTNFAICRGLHTLL